MVTASGQTTTFTYDFAANLISQADHGPDRNLTRSFLLDNLTNVAYETASDGSSYSVLTGRAIDSHLAVSQSNGQTIFGLTDATNSTVAAVDQNGAQQAQFVYEPFGQTGGTGTYPFQFTGRTPVSADLYYYRSRVYNSATGTFLSEDPVRAGENFYSYAGDNPITYTDPLGQQACGSRGGTPHTGGQSTVAVDFVVGPVAQAAGWSGLSFHRFLSWYVTFHRLWGTPQFLKAFKGRKH
jgi:RHS repeat-associated protein